MALYFLFQAFDIFTPHFWEQALSPQRVLVYSASAIRVLIVILLAWVATAIVNRFVPKIRAHMVKAVGRGNGDSSEFAKRADTVSVLLRRTVTSLIWMVAAITALQQTGFDIAPILATAGVAGLAVSFGAQNLVRDVVSGVFLLLENQIRVGDVAEINGTGGQVEEINLRTTRLRSMEGAVHIFPNGVITKLSNLTQEFSYYVWDLGVAYKEDTDKVIDAVRKLAEQMQTEPDFSAMILEPLEVMGVDKFGDSAVILKMRIKTRPIKQWAVGRELNRRIKKRFDELGIEMPFPHRTLYLGEGVARDLAGTGGAPIDRAMLKEVVREVMEEMRNGGGGAPASVSAGGSSRQPASANTPKLAESTGSGEPIEGADHPSSPDPRQKRERGDFDAPPGE